MNPDTIDKRIAAIFRRMCEDWVDGTPLKKSYLAEADRLDPPPSAHPPERPPIPPRHVAWEEADGGGHRLPNGAWFLDSENGQALPDSTGTFSKTRWLLSPPAPPGFHHVPADEGGGYTIGDPGQWCIDTKDNNAAYQLKGPSTGKVWIIAPDTTAGVLFVEHDELRKLLVGEWGIDDDGVYFEWNGPGESTTMRAVTRYELTPAQVAAAMREGDNHD